MKNIILCADDYGQNTAISQAIIALLKEKKLSATSCMTNAPQWLAHSVWLTPFKDQADIGVHFNLTDGKPLSAAYIEAYGETFASLSTLLKKCFLRQLNPSVIYAELNAQLDQFVAGVGRLPDFIDGHQHIHHFPLIRDALLKLYEERLRPVNCYVRSVNDSTAWQRFRESAYLKRLIIQLSGAQPFKQQLIQLRIPHNTSFSGIYDFNHAANYATLFAHFLKESKEGGLIMCHPGLPHTENKDEIAVSRPQEYYYFQNETFNEICQQYNVIIARFPS